MPPAIRSDTPHRAGRVTSEILDRLPPQNLEAEKAVLGCLLLDSDLCDEVALLLRADDFWADAHRTLYQHLLAMHESGRRIDAMLLLDRLGQAGDLEAVGGPDFLAEVAQSVPYAANALHYARIVREKATLRAVIDAGTEILREAWDSTLEPKAVVERAEQKIFAVHDERSSDRVVAIQDLMIEAFERIDARLEHGEGAGIRTWFTDLDRLTGGMHGSEFIVLASRPSMGKTALATNIAENVAIKSNVPTLFISLEMARLELAQRMLCSQGHIDASKFRTGFLSAQDHQNLTKASAVLSTAPLYIDDTPSRTVTEIAATARRMSRKQNLGLLVIDYLQLLQPDDPSDPRQEQVAKMARRLKILARELKVPVLCLAQLNRQVETGREGQRPKLSHLRESGAIEQDADVVMFIHRDEYYQDREEAQQAGTAGMADILVAKQRNGPTGDIKLVWNSKYTLFGNYSSQQSNEEFAEYAPDEADAF
ncbi:MAG: replicative DNA helicase [Pirellulales bacterium]|nr:replicative DNA helicase [Pirellulales bacterium]